VELELGQDGTVCSLAAVPESQLAREHAERALNVAREKGSALAASAVAQIGMPTLVAMGVLVLGWFFLNALTYDAGVIGRLDFTFWQILGFLNSSDGFDRLLSVRDGNNPGIYGLMGWMALAGPFVGAFRDGKRAALGGLLPIAFMLLVAVLAQASLLSPNSGMPAEIADAARDEVRRGISLGACAYISVVSPFSWGSTA
jgi:hypothetical protein